jgi:hypothetical protein
MVGSMVNGYPTYACTATHSQSGGGRCTRHIGAAPLEAAVAEGAVQLLETMPADGLWTVPVITPVEWGGELASSVRAVHRRLTARPVDALDGVEVGAGARAGWGHLSAERQAQVFRFLFLAIRVSASTTQRGVFDPRRVQLLQRPLH